MPFYFMFSAATAGYRLVGEGSGSKVITDRALSELHALSNSQVEELFAEAAGVATKK